MRFIIEKVRPCDISTFCLHGFTRSHYNMLDAKLRQSQDVTVDVRCKMQDALCIMHYD